jgi:hypothetical protein
VAQRCFTKVGILKYAKMEYGMIKIRSCQMSIAEVASGEFGAL